MDSYYRLTFSFILRKNIEIKFSKNKYFFIKNVIFLYFELLLYFDKI